jgi:hypothetical protein
VQNHSLILNFHILKTLSSQTHILFEHTEAETETQTEAEYENL